MSQLPNQFGEATHAMPTERRTSKLAVISLVCSLIFFCPVTTLLGPVIGLIAMATMGSGRKGRGMAMSAIVIGIVLSTGWTLGTVYYIYPVIQKFAQSAKLVISGPSDAMTLGFSGDAAGFKAGFHGDGATASDADALAFIDAARQRYGEFVSCRVDESAGQQAQTGQTQMTFPYIYVFTNDEVSGEAEIIFADPDVGFINKFGFITIFDTERGDLTYPASADGG